VKTSYLELLQAVVGGSVLLSLPQSQPLVTEAAFKTCPLAQFFSPTPVEDVVKPPLGDIMGRFMP
jgi:hypothetical protein